MASRPPVTPEQDSTLKFFTMDFVRNPDETVGLKVQETVGRQGLVVLEVKPQTPAGKWNDACHLTFPENKLLSGDLIIR